MIWLLLFSFFFSLSSNFQAKLERKVQITGHAFHPTPRQFYCFSSLIFVAKMYRFILTTIHTFFESETKYYLSKDQQLQKVIYRLKYLTGLQNSTPPTTKVKKVDHLLFDIFIMNESINRVD